ncbi:thiamine pyrophosphate-binding protein [Chlorobium sp. N1]|uniref:thiamine pyrophosphate-binding protein n=1 Tax=Chlorobium sp. N1 TaxID=2491138 RepID=UPI00103FF289|nr:thiamine pyrophosphate-binding protein [Chlorobium sp. N1]TCD47960.1 thiamine pyrophosphate-binding protein [Chlorobium sp. N1]
MRVADYIAQFIAEHEETAKTVFLVSGGGNMHLIDALGRNEKLRYVCNHHEQACAIAAEGYARVSNKIGIAYVTTGPGGTNAITGVMGAWVDSIPMMIVSGQVKFQTTIASQPELKLRQLGDQEINIVDIVRPITKYAVMITDKSKVRYHLEKAVYEAKHGRPGPVWIDVPLDIQGAQVEPELLEGFHAPSEPVYDLKIDQVVDALKKAERPVVIAGNGIRLSGAQESFIHLVEKMHIPVLTSISGIDVIASDNELFYGRPGILGERAANFILQNSDLLLIIGARMNLRVVSYNWACLARDAFKIMVDIDEDELHKKTLDIDLKIHADASAFIEKMDETLTKAVDLNDAWLPFCDRMKKMYPVGADGHGSDDHVSSYYFARILSDCVGDDAVVVTGNGTAYTSTYQAFKVKKDGRIFANVGCASMGYDLPAAIGACFAAGRKVVCVTGDGSIQMNIQELQTIVHHRLPIVVIVFNNNGYLSIRTTQRGFFDCNYVGEGQESGVSLPDMVKIAEAYGLNTYRLRNDPEVAEHLKSIIDGVESDGPILCEVLMDPFEKLGPKVSSYKKENGSIVSKPLEDLYPFLDRKEFVSNMIVKTVEE